MGDVPRRARRRSRPRATCCSDRPVTRDELLVAWLRALRRAPRRARRRDRRSDARARRRSAGGCGSSCRTGRSRPTRSRSRPTDISSCAHDDGSRADDRGRATSSTSAPTAEPRTRDVTGSRSRATSARNAAASSLRDRPGRGGQRARRRRARSVAPRASSTRGTPRRRAPSASIGTSRSSQLSHSSSSRPRVTPSRQPAVGGGVTSVAVDDEEHVRAGRLAQVALRVREDRLARAACLGVGERADVGRVGDRLQSGGGAALVARPRRDHDVGRGRRRVDRRRDEEHDRRVTGTARRPGRRGPAGDGDRASARRADRSRRAPRRQPSRSASAVRAARGRARPPTRAGVRRWRRHANGTPS